MNSMNEKYVDDVYRLYPETEVPDLILRHRKIELGLFHYIFQEEISV